MFSLPGGHAFCSHGVDIGVAEAGPEPDGVGVGFGVGDAGGEPDGVGVGVGVAFDAGVGDGLVLAFAFAYSCAADTSESRRALSVDKRLATTIESAFTAMATKKPMIKRKT